MPHPQALGRGLNSLIPQKNEEKIGKKIQEVLEIPVEKILRNPYQPRRDFSQKNLEELVESIKTHGIIQPLIATQVPQGYELVAGERRLRAAKILGLKTVPVILRQAENKEKIAIALIENIQRQDLNPIEKGQAYKRLIEEFGFTQEEVAKKVGKPYSVISNTLRYLDLPLEIKEALTNGLFDEGQAKVIVGLETPEKQKQLFQKVMIDKLTVRQTEKEFRRLSNKKYAKVESKRELVLEERKELLEKFLGTKVNIEKRRQGGRIIINYYSEEELDALINKIIN